MNDDRDGPGRPNYVTAAYLALAFSATLTRDHMVVDHG